MVDAASGKQLWDSKKHGVLALDGGFLTVDEVREFENREPIAETTTVENVPAEVASTPEEEGLDDDGA